MTDTHRCEQLAHGCYAALSRLELNPRPIDRKSNALPLSHCATNVKLAKDYNLSQRTVYLVWVINYIVNYTPPKPHRRLCHSSPVWTTPMYPPISGHARRRHCYQRLCSPLCVYCNMAEGDEKCDHRYDRRYPSPRTCHYECPLCLFHVAEFNLLIRCQTVSIYTTGRSHVWRIIADR